MLLICQKFLRVVKIACSFLLFFIFSCSVNSNVPNYRDNQAVNPQQYQQRPPAVKAVPDYYYRQPYAAPQQAPQYQGYQQQYQSRPPQPQYPASRLYNNPYDFAPSPQYPAYDSDQYYVPPSYYNGYEGVPQVGDDYKQKGVSGRQ